MRIWSRASAMAGAAMTRPVRAATASLLLITGDTSAECPLLNFAASLALPHPAHWMPKALRCIHRPLAGGVKLGPDGAANTTFALQLRDSSVPAAKLPQSSHGGLSPAPRFTGPEETASRPRGLQIGRAPA